MQAQEKHATPGMCSAVSITGNAKSEQQAAVFHRQRGGLEEERAERQRAIQDERDTAHANFVAVQRLRRAVWPQVACRRVCLESGSAS